MILRFNKEVREEVDSNRNENADIDYNMCTGEKLTPNFLQYFFFFVNRLHLINCSAAKKDDYHLCLSALHILCKCIASQILFYYFLLLLIKLL